MSAPRSSPVPAHAVMVAAILAAYALATAAMRDAGRRWYGDDAYALLLRLVTAGAPSLAHAAAVVSHLSPRTTWSRNVAAAVALVSEGPDAALALGAMRGNVDRAMRALLSDDPMGTFGPNAHKTRAFALALLRDPSAVVVDVWAARVVGITDERTLKRVGAYAAVVAAYREAATILGVEPTTVQAVTWIVARNGRHA